MKYAVVLAGMVSYSAWWAWDRHALRYSPDFELYTQGGIGTYPSPIGRALGALGVEVFVALSVLAAGAVILLVYKAGGKWAASAIAFSPVTLYLGHAGIDPLGLVLYSAALAGIGPPLMLAGAAFTHTALVPFVLLEAVRGRMTWAQRALLLWFVGLGSLVVLLVTPYGGVVAGLLDGAFPLSFLQGLGAGLLIALPVLAVYRTSAAMVAALMIGAAECGLQGHLQARYLLPAAILGACTGTLRRWPLTLSDRCATLVVWLLRGTSPKQASGTSAFVPSTFKHASTPTSTTRSHDSASDTASQSQKRSGTPCSVTAKASSPEATLRPATSRLTLLGDIACRRWADVVRTLGAGSSGARGGSSSPDYDEGGAISHVAPK